MDSPEEPKENLGLVRTDLANERTLLAYCRTSLMVAGTGVSMVKFLADSDAILYLGWGTAIFGAIIGAVGVIRYIRLRARLHP